MLGICPKCGSYGWDKEIFEDRKQIHCPSCNYQWNFNMLPVFVLTGCSGVGKTTTAQELQQRETKYIVMDADILYNIMPHETEEELHNWVEQILSLSIDIMQGGKTLLWTMAGALEHFEAAYHRRFFKSIYYLALVCDKKSLEERMRNGRHITDDGWIQSSINYNQWFLDNGRLGDQRIDIFDITGKSVSEAADYVNQWVEERL